jgi:hypothetical protein
VITEKGEAPADADTYKGEKDKFKKYFDPLAPGVARKSA